MIRIRKLNLNFLQKLIAFAMLIEVCLFYIFPLPKIFWFGNNGDNKSYILMVLYFAMFFMFVANGLKIRKDKLYDFITPYLVLQVLVAIVLVLRSKSVYSQSWFDMLMCADYLMVPITSIAFMAAMKKEEDYQKMLYLIFIFVFICQVVILIQGIIYNTTSIIIFKGMSSSGVPRMRNGSIRATWTILNFIGLDYAMFTFLNKGKQLATKKQASILLIISIINLVFFCGTRAIVIATFLSFLAMYVFGRKIKLMRKIMIVFLAVVLLFGFGLYGRIVKSFSVDGEYGGSTSVRMHEMDYYTKQIKRNPVFGMGLVRPKRNDLKLIYGGPLGGTPTDVGLVGLVAETGLLGTGCFAILFFRGIYIILKTRKDENNVYLIGLLAYIIATMPSIIITNISYITGMAICVAIFEGVYYRYKYIENDK